MSAIIKFICGVWNDKKRFLFLGAPIAALALPLVIGTRADGVTTPPARKAPAAGRAHRPTIKSVPGLTASKRTIPVFWQSTRSRFLSSGASTHTESFRESWQIEPKDEKTAFLISSRGRAIIYGIDATGDGKLSPTAVVISEKDLARLIGLTPANSELEDSVEGQSLFRLVLSSSPKGGETMTLKTSDDEQYTVQFELGQQQGVH